MGKGLWRKDNHGRREWRTNWKGSAAVEEGQPSLWQVVLGNRNRNTGDGSSGWAVQEGSETSGRIAGKPGAQS